jgi:hypothetical protein
VRKAERDTITKQMFVMLLSLNLIDEDDIVFELYDCLGDRLLWDYEDKYGRL